MEDKLTIAEIKAKIAELRVQVEELQENAQVLWKETDNKNTERVASFMDDELGHIAYELSELEEVEEETEEISEEEAEAQEEWWDGLDNAQKATIVGVPAPSRNDRGDDQFEFDETCNKWWNAKTAAQKREIIENETPWWDK